MPELGRNAIKGDLVLELLPPVLRNAIPPGDAIYPAESPLSSDQDRSRSILRSFSRHYPRAVLLSAASAARSPAFQAPPTVPHNVSCTASPAVLVCGWPPCD